MIVVGAMLLGVVVGSFLNVVVHRVPIGGSVVRPVSRCPGCGETLLRRDNVPMVSYVLLRGRCRHCGKRIPVRYPLVEGLTGLLFVAAALRFEAAGQLLLAFALISVLIALAATDLERRLLPNAIVGPAAGAGFVLSAVAGPMAWWNYPLAALAVGGTLCSIANLYQGGMGMGDVKMGAMLGLFLGPYAALAVFLGALVGTVLYMALVPFGKLGRSSALPFGTFMAVGGLVALFAGPELWNLYLSLIGVG
ncbi:MAG: prepilin peptidase [Actinomycetota bacterium]|nr:prepilin peptidase [Actinomycetota bacterium]